MCVRVVMDNMENVEYELTNAYDVRKGSNLGAGRLVEKKKQS